MTSLETLPQVLGNAEFIALFDNNSAEWLELRSRGIGGSEVSTICGLNKWESAVTMFYKRTGKIATERPDSEPMYWGRALEAPIMNRFIEDNPQLKVYTDVGTWINRKRDYQIVNPDGIFQTEDGEFGIVEIKTARYPDDWANGVPDYYRTQVQYYMNAFGFQHAYVAVLFSGSDYRCYELAADSFQQSVDLERVEEFLAAVKENKAPEWDGSDSTLETVRKMHPAIEDADVEIGQFYEQYLFAKEDATETAQNLQKIKVQILDLMGNAKKATYNGQHVLSRQAKGQGTPFLVEKRG
jgi:putative phage-type endonuclease